jgi:transcriptional regulator with XRE-family HTH domain
MALRGILMMTADEITDFLAAKRAEMGWTQRDLAKRIGYAQSTLEYWESEERQPRLSALLDWAEGLRCRIIIESIEDGEL